MAAALTAAFTDAWLGLRTRFALLAATQRSKQRCDKCEKPHTLIFGKEKV